MKDAAFIRRLGAETSTPTPIIDQAWNHLTTAKAIGGSGLDWSACSTGMRVSAGLPPFKGEDFSLHGHQLHPRENGNGIEPTFQAISSQEDAAGRLADLNGLKSQVVMNGDAPQVGSEATNG